MKKRRKKVVVILIIILLLLLLGFIVYKFVFDKEEKIKVLDSLDKYGYYLEDRDTELYKSNFEELKSILKKKDINYESYAKSISKLFVIDLFTLNNKVSKYDIGGADFVYENNVDNYKLNVQDTLYKIIENNIKGKRKQKLPEVKSITIDKVEETKFKIGEEESDAYKINLSWDYKTDYDYDNEAQIIVVRKDKKVFIAEYSSEE